jgi:ABC-type antimicrobial peptide transport system permease subunit
LIFGDPGYATRDIHVARYSFYVPGDSGFNRLASTVVDSRRRTEAIASLPGVTSVSLAGAVPGAQIGVLGQSFALPDDPTRSIDVWTIPIDSQFVSLLDLKLLYGREPTDADTSVALINQSLARALFGHDDVVGESLPLSAPGGVSTAIIGVLEDVSFEHPLADIPALAFMTGLPAQSTLAVIESTVSSADVEVALRELAASGAIEVAPSFVTSLASERSQAAAPDRARGALTITTALLVVSIAAFGFYGTQRYLVAAGRREYAIRAALGAGPRALGRLVLARGLTLGLPGLVLGALLAFIITAWLRGDYVVRAVSPLIVTTIVIAGLAALMIAASVGPARRARQTAPAQQLREE